MPHRDSAPINSINQTSGRGQNPNRSQHQLSFTLPHADPCQQSAALQLSEGARLQADVMPLQSEFPLFEARHPWCLMWTCSFVWCVKYPVEYVNYKKKILFFLLVKQPDIKRLTFNILCAALGWRHFRGFMHMFSVRGAVSLASLVSNKVLNKEKVKKVSYCWVSFTV